MNPLILTHNGKKYQFTEPTIRIWSEVMRMKDILSQEEMNIKLISLCMGMTREDVIECSADQIISVATKIEELLNLKTKEFHSKIEFKNKKYVLVDFAKIKFGQFVDIDTFLSKDETFRIKNLSQLASYLYNEEGIEYSKIDFKKQAEIFEDLPVKYIEGAVFFLVNLGLTLHHLSQIYSEKRLLWRMTRLMIRFPRIGAGIKLFLLWLGMIYVSLKLLLLSPWYLVSTIWRSCKTKIKKLKNK